MPTSKPSRHRDCLRDLRGEKQIPFERSSNLEDLGLPPDAAIKISAQNETGLKDLLDHIEHTLRVMDFNITQPLCVTPRQQRCVENILAAHTLDQAQKQLELVAH